MALSRIWAAFIIVSVLAACFQCVFTKNNTDIFNRMVVGKSGDTSRTKFEDSSVMPATILHTLQSGTQYHIGNIRLGKGSNVRAGCLAVNHVFGYKLTHPVHFNYLNIAAISLWLVVCSL